MRPRRSIFFLVCPALLSIVTSPVRPESSTDSELEFSHVQNAGVWLRWQEHTLLVDALTDLTVDPDEPPRPFDHLSSASLQLLREGRSAAGCVDLALVTHLHADHFDSSVARDYLRACPHTVLCHPEGLDGEGARSRSLPVTFGAEERFESKGILLSTLGLHHVSSGADASPHPHLGYVVHLGPWDVVHVGDAAASAENLALLAQALTSRQALLFVPYWFLDAEPSRAWLAELPPEHTDVLGVRHALRAAPAGDGEP